MPSPSSSSSPLFLLRLKLRLWCARFASAHATLGYMFLAHMCTGRTTVAPFPHIARGLSFARRAIFRPRFLDQSEGT